MTAVGGLVVTIKVNGPTMRLRPNSDVHPGAACFAPISVTLPPPSIIHLPEVESQDKHLVQLTNPSKLLQIQSFSFLHRFASSAPVRSITAPGQTLQLHSFFVALDKKAAHSYTQDPENIEALPQKLGNLSLICGVSMFTENDVKSIFSLFPPQTSAEFIPQFALASSGNGFVTLQFAQAQFRSRVTRGEFLSF